MSVSCERSHGLGSVCCSTFSPPQCSPPWFHSARHNLEYFIPHISLIRLVGGNLTPKTYFSVFCLSLYLSYLISGCPVSHYSSFNWSPAPSQGPGPASPQLWCEGPGCPRLQDNCQTVVGSSFIMRVINGNLFFSLFNGNVLRTINPHSVVWHSSNSMLLTVWSPGLLEGLLVISLICGQYLLWQHSALLSPPACPGELRRISRHLLGITSIFQHFN